MTGLAVPQSARLRCNTSRARGGSGRCAMSLSVPEQKPAQLLDCAPA
jgi:hypothetical protein